MRRLCVVAVLAVAGCGSTSGTPAKQAPQPLAVHARMSAKDIVQRSSPAIVQIVASTGDKDKDKDDGGREQFGTGFVVDKTGLVATNLHVVAGQTSIKIKLLDGSQLPVTAVAGYDMQRDLAVLRVRPAKPLPTIVLGDSDAMSAGDQVVAIGNPLGFDYSVTSGLISQVRPICGKDTTPSCPKELTVLQFSAAISHGSSGGPLFNQFGEVIAVTTAILPDGQNLNLAVPTNYLRPLLGGAQAIAIDQFAKDTKVAEAGPPDEDDHVKIVREVPALQPSVYDGCNVDDIGEIVRQILSAIDNGAPLYNEGQHEACYRIYEGTAFKFEHDVACAGVRTAFGDGLLRASGKKTYTEKAWAMRDTFDGLIEAARRWAEKHPQSPKHAGTKPPPTK
jgi:S1-C subfamily serine protease